MSRNFNLSNLFDSIVDRQALAQAGQTSVFIIKKRTQKGTFLPGSSPGAESYSTDPFAMPAGGLAKKVFNRVDDTDEGNTFFTRAGALWVMITKGYKRYRELAGLQSSKVDLDFRTGPGMLSALNVTKIDPRNKHVEVGFTDKESEQIAIWHQIQGAGKSKTIRKFVGHTNKEEQKITETTSRQVFQNITKWNS